ncbi:MAG: universal stress protein [Proteobacteria bacterium]|nr:MAG: universal stress protein [Pseudomonadota bacterium]
MFRKIYVPVDNTDISDRVLSEALDLAKSTGAQLRVCHIVNLEQVTFGVEMIGVIELKDALINIGNAVIQQVKDKALAAGVEVEAKLIENYGSDIASIIVEDATEFGADLFVLGSHHLGSFAHFITGGIAEDLAHDTDIPILLITKHKE